MTAGCPTSNAFPVLTTVCDASGRRLKAWQHLAKSADEGWLSLELPAISNGRAGGLIVTVVLQIHGGG